MSGVNTVGQSQQPQQPVEQGTGGPTLPGQVSAGPTLPGQQPTAAKLQGQQTGSSGPTIPTLPGQVAAGPTMAGQQPAGPKLPKLPGQQPSGSGRAMPTLPGQVSAGPTLPGQQSAGTNAGGSPSLSARLGTPGIVPPVQSPPTQAPASDRPGPKINLDVPPDGSRDLLLKLPTVKPLTTPLGELLKKAVSPPKDENVPGSPQGTRKALDDLNKEGTKSAKSVTDATGTFTESTPPIKFGGPKKPKTTKGAAEMAPQPNLDTKKVRRKPMDPREQQ
jgi:hypothetical protein